MRNRDDHRSQAHSWAPHLTFSICVPNHEEDMERLE
jgi:hypothetical protein